MKYRVIVTYAAGNTDADSFVNLDTDQLYQVVNAFTSDLVNLEGKGIVRMVVEVMPS